MGLSKEDVEKIVKKQQDEMEKDYVFCETCKFALDKKAAYKVLFNKFVPLSLYMRGDDIYNKEIFYCKNHTPKYDEIVQCGEERTYYKNIPAKRVEVKLKNK